MALAFLLFLTFSIVCFSSPGDKSASESIPLGIFRAPTLVAAQQALKRLKAGMDFSVLAREKSTDPTGINGGYMGDITPTDLLPELQAALKPLKPGEFSSVIPTVGSFAILTVFAAKPRGQDLNADHIITLVHNGAVRDTIDVSGMAAANAALQAYTKPDGWNRDPAQVCAARTNSYSSTVARLSRQLIQADALPAGKVKSVDLLQGHAVLALLFVYTGEMDKSLAEWNQAYQIAQESVPNSLPYVEEALGVTHLHLAEMENGVYKNPGQQGFFPSAIALPKQEHVHQALRFFSKCLARQPDNYEVRWLMNVAYSALGEYPSQVPPPYLIAPGAFTSKGETGHRTGHFKDVGPAAGLNVFTGAGGVIADDFDNDGLLDVVTSSMDMCEPMHLFHNNGNGTFSDRTDAAGLSAQLGGLNVIQADYNNDGCMDLLVLRGGWEAPNRKSMLRNNCNGTFTDVTEESGLNKTVTSTQTAVFADIDNDGYLDLFIGNENAPSQLFHNRGDGTFEDISHSAGIDQVAVTKGVTATDYDNDGFPDFYVSNVNGANYLYHNNGDKTFTEIARQAGVQAPYFSFATWFFDYDNDGWPDLFVSCYFSSMDEVIRSYMGLPVSTETLKLYRNLHNGAFEDVTAKVGLDKVMMPMGSNFGDFDNDGFLDIYLGEGQPSLASLMPHVLFHNNQGNSFTDVSTASGTGELHKGHGISFADLERSGQEDILAGLGGAVPSDKHVMRVFQNPGNDNDWINIKLTGVKSNRAAVGARIQLTVDGGGHQRSIYRTVGGTSSFGGNPMEQHIGLGHAARIAALDIWWPATNTRQHFTGLGVDQFIGITEFAGTYKKLERKPALIGK